MRQLNSNAGFTIVELMIATAVFSTILLLCATGLIVIGRTYQKGNTSRATQEVARSVMDQIKHDFELSGGSYKKLPPESGSGFCIGDNLYSYEMNRKTDGGSVHGFVLSRPAGGCDVNGSVVAENLNSISSGARELLGKNMRLAELAIVPHPGESNPKSISIRINVIAGDDDLLNGTKTGCLGGAGQEYCASAALESYATRRLQ